MAKEEILVDVPAGNWARLMELVEGLAKLEPEPSKSASQLQLGLATHHDDNDVLVFWMMNRMGRGTASTVLTQRNLWLSPHSR